jgi:NTP pyrophosphatase (non-canonical NTP hydrolase)
MNIKELQERIKEVDDFIVKKMGNFSNPNLVRCLKAQEELGEVADVLVKMELGSRKGKMNIELGKKELGKEIVDVIVPLIAIADAYGVDLEPIFGKKLQRDIKRYQKIE